MGLQRRFAEPHLLLKFRGVLHHGKRLVAVKVRLPIPARQTQKIGLSILQAAVTDEPPNRG